MEKKIIEASIVEIHGEYGIARVKETVILNNETVYGRTQTWYDVCLDKGEGDIVASFKRITNARKWAKEN